MNWFKRAQSEDDAIHDYFDTFTESKYEILDEFAQRQPGQIQPWQPASFAKVKRIWNDEAHLGFIRNENWMDEIADKVIKNISKLQVNTELMGHTMMDPTEDFEGFGMSEKDEDDFGDWAVQREGNYEQYRISDYALESLVKAAIELLQAKDAMTKYRIVDRIFNMVHQRFDLAALFIEGGSASFLELFEAKD